VTLPIDGDGDGSRRSADSVKMIIPRTDDHAAVVQQPVKKRA
jgi:hypothetical protein